MQRYRAEFIWWRVEDGVAIAYDDTPETRALIDAGIGLWFGNIEGTILHGGVQATAFRRYTEQTYDARVWLETGEMIPAGEITHTAITASAS